MSSNKENCTNKSDKAKIKRQRHKPYGDDYKENQRLSEEDIRNNFDGKHDEEDDKKIKAHSSNEDFIDNRDNRILRKGFSQLSTEEDGDSEFNGSADDDYEDDDGDDGAVDNEEDDEIEYDQQDVDDQVAKAEVFTRPMTRSSTKKSADTTSDNESDEVSDNGEDIDDSQSDKETIDIDEALLQSENKDLSNQLYHRIIKYK